MIFRYLGTGAAEGTPAVMCQCPLCREAREKGGRFIRTRMQAMIDGKLLLDFGPDTYLHSLQYGLDLCAVHSCLITHVHEDHFYPADIRNRKRYACYPDEEIPLTVFGSAEVGDQLGATDGGNVTGDGRVVFRQVTAFEPFTTEGFTVTPLPAIHNTRQPLIYLIQKEERSVLYAHDTNGLSPETWDYLKKHPLHLDLVSVDCTEGMTQLEGPASHMNFTRDAAFRRQLIETGLADERTRVIASHIAHNAKVGYEGQLDPAVNEGIEISFDGMEIEI